MNIIKTWWQKFLKMVKGKATDIVQPPDPSTVPTGETIKLWPAFQCPGYMSHGFEEENAMRNKAHDDAVAAGFDCIYFHMRSFPTPHVAVEILDWESDKEKGKFVGKAHKRATSLGITRWQVDAVGNGDLAKLYDFFKHYNKGCVQFMIGRSFTEDDMRILKCDNQGIKVSDPEMRK